MKFWGWTFRIFIATLGIGLFFLQSQFAKKTILELVVNQPFKNSTLKVEAEGIHGLFPFHFTVDSLKLKEGDQHLATLPGVSAVWSVPDLIKRKIKVTVAKGAELAGDISYIIGRHALFINIKGKGLSLGNKGSLQSIVTEFPTLDLLKGQVVITFHDGQEPVILTLELEELDKERLKIQDILLTGKEIVGKGAGILYPRQGTWEGKVSVNIASLASYKRWVQKDLEGSASLTCQKNLKNPLLLDLHVNNFRYGNVEAKALNAQAVITGKDQINLKAEGQETRFNTVPLTKVFATASLVKKKGSFVITGAGQKNISVRTQGAFNLPSPSDPHTRITIIQAALTHPLHQFSLTEPATITWDEQGVQAPKLWVATGKGTALLEDLAIGKELSGKLFIDHLPLTLLRIIDPTWIASGSLSGEGKLQGSVAHPEAELSLKGKSLTWEKNTRPRNTGINRSLGIDLSSAFRWSEGFLTWQVSLAGGRLVTLTSEGKVSVETGYPREESSLDATLKGRGDLSLISLFVPYGDLIQGQASVELTATGTVKKPSVNGHISVVKGLYENAAFGTLIKNIELQGKASEGILTVSSITGTDNAKGRVSGHGSLKFMPLLNPTLDLQLTLDNLIVVQNDEISGKAKGTLRLYGSLGGQAHEKARITGDLILHPLEVRLDEHTEEIVTIRLLEKKKDGSYQTLSKHHKHKRQHREASSFPLDIKLSSPEQIYLRGYGFDAQWKGEMRVIGTLLDPQLVGQIDLVQGRFTLLNKPLKLTEGRITYSQEPRNDPSLLIVGIRDMGEITATMRIEGHASDPKITFSSSPALPQEEVLAQLLFGKGMENMSVTQSLLLANTLTTFKGKNNLNFTDKIRSAFGLDVLEFKERKSPEGDDFQSATQQVSVGKQLSDKVYLSLDQSVSGERETSATVQLDVTPSLKIEADVGGDKNAGVGFAWVKKY